LQGAKGKDDAFEVHAEMRLGGRKKIHVTNLAVSTLSGPETDRLQCHPCAKNDLKYSAVRTAKEKRGSEKTALFESPIGPGTEIAH